MRNNGRRYSKKKYGESWSSMKESESGCRIFKMAGRRDEVWQIGESQVSTYHDQGRCAEKLPGNYEETIPNGLGFNTSWTTGSHITVCVFYAVYTWRSGWKEGGCASKLRSICFLFHSVVEAWTASICDDCVDMFAEARGSGHGVDEGCIWRKPLSDAKCFDSWWNARNLFFFIIKSGPPSLPPSLLHHHRNHRESFYELARDERCNKVHKNNGKKLCSLPEENS